MLPSSGVVLRGPVDCLLTVPQHATKLGRGCREDERDLQELCRRWNHGQESHLELVRWNHVLGCLLTSLKGI